MRIAFCIFFIFLSLSCTKQNIYDTLTVDNSLNNASGISNFVVGAYSRLSAFDAFKVALISFFLTADDINTRPLSSYGIRYSTKTHDAFTVETSNFWNSLYVIINRSNYLLDKIDVIPADTAFKARAIGEMKFLRAFSYFYLVRLWGDVPFKLKATNLVDDNLRLPRTSTDSIYQQIFNDFTDASKVLYTKNKQPSTEFGRATKGAAFAMLSKAYLTYASMLKLKSSSVDPTPFYQKAKDYADSVISSNQYTLIPNYNNLWDVEQERNAYQEVIFGIQFTKDNQVANATSLGSEFATMFMPSTMPNVAATGVNKTGSGNLRVQPWFAERYSTGDYQNDYRTDVTFLTRWFNLSTTPRTVITFPILKASTTSNEIIETQPYLGKYRDGKALDARNCENDLFITRLADVILMKAEAENEINGPTTIAYSEFNKLRTRARNANGTTRTTPANLPAGLSQSQFRNKIIDERALELAGEGHRWFDLVRMQAPDGKSMMEYQFDTYLPTLPIGLPIYDNTTRSWLGGRTESNSLPKFRNSFLLLPIPLSELNANDLPQNPGY